MAETNTTAIVGNQFTYSNLPATMICILGVVSNVLLLVAFIKDPLKCFRNSGTYLVMNLSVSDCLTSLLFLLDNMIPKISSDKVLTFLTFWIPGTSFVSITSISIDRFFMVASPIKHRILMKGKVFILLISAIWLVSCVISAFLLFSDSQSVRDGQAFFIFSLITVTISAVVYSCTYYKLKKQSKNRAIQTASERRAQEVWILKEKRFLKTIIIIACAAFVCTVPFLVLISVYSFLWSKLNSTLFLICNFVFYANFALNPLIYILRLLKYRRTFYLLYFKRRTASSWFYKI